MKIAIKGHVSRGKEVIRILESLGGKNDIDLEGDNQYVYYGICENHIMGLSNLTKCKCYTLEEFEKEFPFKVGDKVTFKDDDYPYTIKAFDIWSDGDIVCEFVENGLHYSINKIKPYKEMKEERNITLTLDKAKEWYKKGGELKEIALQVFTKKELTKVDLPKTWEEFCNNYPTKIGEYYIDSVSDISNQCMSNEGRCIETDRNVCPSKKSAEAHLAMIQLEQLRDCWRQGNIPQGNKYKIRKVRNVYTITWGLEDSFLSFCDNQTAEEFLKCFKDLIEQAGDLI